MKLVNELNHNFCFIRFSPLLLMEAETEPCLLPPPHLFSYVVLMAFLFP